MSKLTISVVSIGAIICVAMMSLGIWLAYSFFGIGYEGRDNRAWEEVKHEPFIQTIGRWGGQSYNKEVVINNTLLPVEMSYQQWVSIMSKNDFTVIGKDKGCWRSNIHDLASLKNYDNCAFRIIGPKDCSYVYVIASKFEEGNLKKSIATHSHYICM